jgi:hypothetical protein
MGMPTIETKRLVPRAIALKDAASIQKHFNERPLAVPGKRCRPFHRKYRFIRDREGRGPHMGNHPQGWLREAVHRSA